MKKMILCAIALFLVGCSSAPAPKVPDESNRQPINKTVPAELKEVLL